MFNCDQVFSAFPCCTLAGKTKERLVHKEHSYPNIKLLLQVVMVDDLAKSRYPNIKLLPQVVMVDDLAEKVNECPLSQVIKYWLCTLGTVKTVCYTE